LITEDQIKEFFSDLKFVEDTHTYTVGDKKLPSVSHLIEQYSTPFNKDISKFVAIKRGISQAEVLAEWEAIAMTACLRGNKAHDFGENYLFDRTLKPTTPLEEAIVKFWDAFPDYIVPVGAEIKMYHKEFDFSGTMDIFLYNTRNDTYIIGDYKTNKDLFKNHKGQKMLGSFSDVLDDPFNHYQVQLSFYQILIEQLGLKVSNRFLLWLKDDATYEFHKTKNAKERILKDLNNGRFTALNSPS
jgi:hypothetical protein